MAEPRVLFLRGAALGPELRHARCTAASLPARQLCRTPLGQAIPNSASGPGCGHWQPGEHQQALPRCSQSPLLHAPPGRQVATLTYIAQTLLANNSEHSMALGVPKCSCRQSYSSLQGVGLLPALPLRPSAPQAQGQARNPELRLRTPSSTSSEPSFSRGKGTGTASAQRAAFCPPQVQQRNGLPCCRCFPDTLVFGMCMHIHNLQFSSSPLTPPALSCVQHTLRL